MKIAVLGAGIAGITSAFELANDGHKVTVFEKHSTAATANSFANSGILGVSQAHALDTETSNSRLLRFLNAFKRVSIQKSNNFRNLRWLWQWSHFRQSGLQTLQRDANRRLVQYSQARFEQLSNQLNLEFEQSSGLLWLMSTPALHAKAQKEIESLKCQGIACQDLNPTALSGVEPALNGVKHIHAAIHFPNDAVANCRQFALLLKEKAIQAGVQFQFNTEVTRIEANQNPSGIQLSLHGHTTPQTFDSVVICTGELPPALPNGLRLRQEMASVYSYALSIPIREALNAPRSAIVDAENHITLVRLGNRIRIAGGAELGRGDMPHNAKTVQSLYKALQCYFPGAASQPFNGQVWRGAQVHTADGLPAIGPSPIPGIWLNLAHGSNGWGMACGAARVIADQIQRKTPEMDATPFAPSRLFA